MDVNCLKNRVLELYRLKNWKDILSLNNDSKNESALKLLWVWPQENDLFFIKRSIKEFGCKGISSIGCGCGLLEWIINQYTGLEVLGYEVNREWWESKYSNPTFIKLKYVENMQDVHLNPTYALLFCYFNDKEAFQQYVKRYEGNVILIIGPGKESWKHTDPRPFSPDFGTRNHEWLLYNYHQVKDTTDYIALYVKIRN